jgi:hypothetical protein
MIVYYEPQTWERGKKQEERQSKRFINVTENEYVLFLYLTSLGFAKPIPDASNNSWPTSRLDETAYKLKRKEDTKLKSIGAFHPERRDSKPKA